MRARRDIGIDSIGSQTALAITTTVIMEIKGISITIAINTTTISWHGDIIIPVSECRVSSRGSANSSLGGGERAFLSAAGVVWNIS